jgi:hypothetical protein
MQGIRQEFPLVTLLQTALMIHSDCLPFDDSNVSGQT